MKGKKLIKRFYATKNFGNIYFLKKVLHEDIILNWYSSKGFKVLGKKEILNIFEETKSKYVSLRAVKDNMIGTNKKISLSFKCYCKLIENPSEELPLATFMVHFVIKDDQLFRGYLMSQLY